MEELPEPKNLSIGEFHGSILQSEDFREVHIFVLGGKDDDTEQ